ncbi:hypothetical protein [uncultured Dubosiella sp.]|uniref:hypothetical protein n=1 Tax=uncultured Dubosiella sp. TaxID=1937011 RepID=UPI002636DBCB|nr:hypothetical protein [uncultured Dubosiella sp.]
MGKKIAMVLMGLVIVTISGLYIYKEFFTEPEPVVEKVDIFKDALKKVDIQYVPYGDSNNETLLLIKNDNKFQVNIAGTIEKKDENGVHNENYDDEIDINLNPGQTYVLETTNPNNKVAREGKLPIDFKADQLKISPVAGSNEDGKRSTKILMQDNIDVQFFPERKNDSGQPLISIENKTKRKLTVSGYIIYYTSDKKEEIKEVIPFEFTEIPKNETYRDYVYIGFAESDNKDYTIYVNICE